MEPFCHLHTHTTFSHRDALQKLDSMCAAAAADGQKAIAVTDHGNLAASWKFANAAGRAGLRPIHGIELYLAHGSCLEQNTEVAVGDDQIGSGGGDTQTDRQSGTKRSKYYHLTVLAADRVGWRNLLLLSNAAHESPAFWHKPRVGMELLDSHSYGLVVLTGCLGGPVAGPLAAGDPDRATRNLRTLVDIFGAERLFVEVMNHGIPTETAILPQLVELARTHGLRLVATNDAHYTHSHEAQTHDAWLCLGGTNVTVDTPGRWRFQGEGYHLRTAEEMRQIFDGLPGCDRAVVNTALVAEMVEARVLPEEGQLRLPRYFEPGHVAPADSAGLLYDLMTRGAEARYGHPLPEQVTARLRFEYEVISELRLSDYFLVVADMIGWARGRGIRVGPGRGSAGGSLIAFCLGITTIDPLAHGLLFERFLSLDRAKMPDIDTDFEQVAVPQVMAYLAERWGPDRVARIGTFGMSLAAASLRSAGKVTGQGVLGARLADTVTKGSGGKPLSLAALEDPNNEAGAEFRKVVADPAARVLVEMAKGFEGQVNNEGIHACGVVVSDEPLPGLVPLRRDRRDGGGQLVTEWDGGDIESFGLLKLDVLGVRNLDVISAAARLIEQRNGGGPLDVDNPPDDSTDLQARAAWRLIADGRTAGCFQLESSGMTKLAIRVAPQNIDELATVIALFRPGPLAAGLDQLYVRRKAGAEAVSYDYLADDPAEAEAIGSVLGETFGVCVFQEQLMRLGEVVAGFGPDERNRLQRAVSKKKRDEMEAVGELFVAGALKPTASAGSPKLVFSAATAERVWAAMKGAADYAFNKSHSVGYAKTAYVTAFLKANWPAEFAAALLSVTSEDDKRVAVLRSLRAEGIPVLGPDVNVSRTKTSVADTGAVRLGLGEIKGVGVNADAVVTERDRGGPFAGLADLLGRVTVTDPKTGQAKNLPVNIVEAMIEAGAFDSFGARLGQSMALKALRDSPEVTVSDIEWGVIERATRERLRLGVLVSSSPLQSLNGKLDRLKHRGSRPSQTVAIHRISGPGGQIYTIGVVARFEVAKQGARRAYLTLEGSHASIDCVMWGDALDRTEVNGRLPAVGDIVGVEGKVKQTVRDRRGPDEYTDEAAPNAEPSLELLINQVWSADIDDSPSVTNGRSQSWPALTALSPASVPSTPAKEAVAVQRGPVTAPEAA